MPQILVFPCPSCGASLSYEGGPEAAITCQFCGSNAPIPAALRASAAPPAPTAPIAPAAPSGAGPSAESPLEAMAASMLGSVLGGAGSNFHLDQLRELKHLAQSGQQAQAVQLFRTLFPAVSADEAQAAVAKISGGQPLVINTGTGAGMPATAPGISSALQLAEVAQLARAGRKLEAVKRYRELAPNASLQEAVAAIEKMLAGEAGVLTSAEVTSSRPTDQGTTLDQVAQLARSGHKIEAIKLYRQHTGVGLKEAKDAVEAMTGGTSGAASAPAARPARRGCSCGALFTVLLVLAIGGFVAAMLYVPFRLSGSYRQALAAAQNNPSVQDALGTPITESWVPPTGEISCGDSACSANYTIPIQGSHKSGRIIVLSDSKGGSLFFNEGTWTLDARVMVDGGGIIDLRGGNKPAISESEPTAALPISPADADATQGAGSRATQRAGATATQQEAAAATATAVVKALEDTQVAVEMRTTATAIAAQQTDWHAKMTDAFGNNRLGWPIGLKQDDYIALTTTLKSGQYLWTVNPKEDGSYWNLMPAKGLSYTDFVATTTVQFSPSGPDNNYAYGLVFRQVDQDYGFFGIRPDGTAQVLVVYSNSIYQDYELDSAALDTQPGKKNQITVRAIGPDFVFLINDQLVWRLHEDFSPGEIGLGVNVSTKGAPAQVTFTSLDIRAP